MAACTAQQDACIIFEREEGEVGEEVAATLCRGVEQCQLGTASRIVQGRHIYHSIIVNKFIMHCND